MLQACALLRRFDLVDGSVTVAGTIELLVAGVTSFDVLKFIYKILLVARITERGKRPPPLIKKYLPPNTKKSLFFKVVVVILIVVVVDGAGVVA